MSFEVKDLVGLSKPLEKLIEVVSSAVGTVYRPRQIRSDADAKAYEIKMLERAKVEAELDGSSARFHALQDRVSAIAKEYPELAERAKQRLLAREIEGQLNVEQIADQAVLALPAAVSNEPVSADWRRKFFMEAENVCEVDMQALWGKVLAGEIAQPGSFGLRTLETLKQLTREEAEMFRKMCGLAMNDGAVLIPGFDINTALKAFDFDFNSILQLRDAGLVMHGDGICKNFAPVEPMAPPFDYKVTLMNNGVVIQLSGPGLLTLNHLSLIFTQAGRELQRLIANEPNDAYFSQLGATLRQRSVVAKRGSLVPQDANSSLIVFEQDL